MVFQCFLDEKLRNIGKTNKNHEFLIFLHRSLKIMFFLVFIGFSNVSEVLVKKTLEKPIETKKKHDFQTMVQENQKFMAFIGVCNVSELLVKKTLENQ